jgi:4'-phosphopantetheinyl transferase EntD
VPLFYEQIINTTTKLGIWKIEEDENFFLAKVPLQHYITHPHKRLQHLAGRYLLQFLFPDFPYAEILIADTRKPYLPNEQYHFSISHCGDYAAAIASSTNRVGIDIEIPSEKIERIAHKFVHEEEKQWLEKAVNDALSIHDLSSVNQQLLTVLWSAKETVFKWYSLGGIDFKEHMQLNGIITKTADKIILPFVFKKQTAILLQVQSVLFDEIVLSWVL